MLPAVRGASSPRMPLRVHGIQLKLSTSSRFSIRGHPPALHSCSTTYQQQRILTTKRRCDSTSPVSLTTSNLRPSLALAKVPMGTTTVQARSHAGHSHHHHHDNTYLTSTNKHDAGVRITRIGLYVNLGMAISKGVGGYVFHSQGASAYH